MLIFACFRYSVCPSKRLLVARIIPARATAAARCLVFAEYRERRAASCSGFSTSASFAISSNSANSSAIGAVLSSYSLNTAATALQMSLAAAIAAVICLAMFFIASSSAFMVSSEIWNVASNDAASASFTNCRSSAHSGASSATLISGRLVMPCVSTSCPSVVRI